MQLCNSHELQARWAEEMLGYAGFLVQQSNQNAELAATLTRLELPNLFALLAGNAAEAATLLDQLADDANLPRWLHPFIAALQEIAAGSRDRTLADNPELHFTSVAEILFLIETLEEAVNG